MNFILRLLVSAVAVLLTAWILPGVDIRSFGFAIIVAFVLALLNIIVKPILVFLTIPITIVTLGLFLLVINALMIMLAGEIVSGFYVANFWWALLFSLILSLFSYLFGLRSNIFQNN
ncbi:MAG: phage holin family protein [Bacteroidales bacterium]|nr:phage holin family protein [Bacteroidales bacterium]MCF8386331.1 phage holin family protein [Bacteroidales bacterium]MCF8398208.1 phage holin family protein [Bacteroidales bacterium]